MSTYSVWLKRYNGDVKEEPEARQIRSLTNARATAYRILSHKGKVNAKGEYKALIYERKYGLDYYRGEVQNHAWDDRYWYPYGSGKYELKSNGKLGKKLR